MQVARLPAFRYLSAIVFVGAATGFSLALRSVVPDGFLAFFLGAVMLAGWYGRTSAGLLAVVLSMVVVDYYFIAPYQAFGVELDELPYFLTFLLSAIVTSWLGSARRQVEERQKAHLDELFEQTPDAIMLVGVEDEVLRINREFTRIFGYSPAEVVDRRSMDLIVPSHLKAAASEARERLYLGQHVSLETVRQRRNGTQVDVSEVSFPVIADGKPLAYYVIYRDITSSKRALEELQTAQGELARLSRITTMGELAASIAHEINQPIGAIVTNSNAAVRWLEQKPPDVDDAREALDWIVRDANRASEVIGRIRSLLAKSGTPMVPLDVNEVIREVLTVMSYEIHRRGASVTTDLATPMSAVLGDRVQLQQVVLNLIMNSIDAMTSINDRKRELKIRSLGKPDCVLVEVQDSGPGWDDQHATSMFDPFFTTKTNGIGMGLAISRSIIEAHGGQLWAERGTPFGATLRFSLPVVDEVERTK